MHFGDKLFSKIREKETFLCLGLDPHLDLIPKVFQKENEITKEIYSLDNVKIVENFCFNILETCISLVPAIKLQIAFFEQLGPEGMKIFSSLCKFIKNYGNICIIDAKRGDIGSTNTAYFNTFFADNSPYPCDAITVNPWLGIDSIKAFTKNLKINHGLFVLGHTSNPGSADIQRKMLNNNNRVYEELIDMLVPIIKEYEGNFGLSSIGIVTGATNSTEIKKLRKKLTSSPFLIPGFGAQGGSLESARSGLIKDDGYNNMYNMGIVNSSRGLCFPNEANNCMEIKEWRHFIKNNLLKTSSQLKLKK